MAEHEERESLRESLGAAFDEVFGEEPAGDSEEGVADDDSVEEGQEEDSAEVEEDSGEDAGEDALEDQSAEHPDKEDGDESQDDDGDELEPLKHWHREDKEVFKTLPKPAQEFLLRRDKEFQASATKKQMEVADIKRAFDPVRDQLVKGGVSEADAIRRLLGAHMSLMENPKESIVYLMQQYGINPSDILGTAESDSGSTDKAANQEVQELKARLRAFEERTYNERVSELQGQLAEFGKKNEFFERVQAEMAELVTSYKVAQKPVPALEELYEKACWMNDSVRKEMLDRKQQEEMKKKAERGEKNISKAKRAAKATVHPSHKVSTGSKQEEARSLRDDLSDNFDRLTKAR